MYVCACVYKSSSGRTIFQAQSKGKRVDGAKDILKWGREAFSGHRDKGAEAEWRAFVLPSLTTGSDEGQREAV